MILQTFPGTAKPTPEARRAMSLFGRENILVKAQTDQIAFGRHTAPLSIKTTFSGCEWYEVEGHRIAIDQHSFLVLNRDQVYASSIESNVMVESFCIFFRDELEHEILTAHFEKTEWLLDDPDRLKVPAEPFVQCRQRHDEVITPILRQLHHRVSHGGLSQLQLDEQAHRLVEGLLDQQSQTNRAINALPGIRPATRQEIYRRLCRARDYLESCFDEPVSLASMARVACLSQHHFLRLFKQAFGTTPHQYLTAVRLEHAQRLLAQNRRSVTDVCFAVGFEHAGSFARLFKRRFGQSPSAFHPPG